MTNIIGWTVYAFLILRGKYRIIWGFCPKCNSDAPEMDECSVCNSYRWGAMGPYPSKIIKYTWWNKYISYIKYGT